MTMEVKVLPKNIWVYFCSNAVKLMSALLCVAENDGWSVWITNDDGQPVFQVCCGDEPVHEYTAMDNEDIEENYIFALEDIGIVEPDDYSDPGTPSAEYGDSEDDSDYDFDIELRESELDHLTENYIEDMVDGSIDSEILEQATKTIKEVVCDILAKQYGISLCRPMWLVGEDGNKFFSEYPYPSILAAEKAERDRNRIKE